MFARDTEIIIIGDKLFMTEKSYQDKESEITRAAKRYSELPNEEKAAFDTVCTVMRMLRSGIIDRATPTGKFTDSIKNGYDCDLLIELSTD